MLSTRFQIQVQPYYGIHNRELAIVKPGYTVRLLGLEISFISSLKTGLMAKNYMPLPTVN
mgnify:CR=1 FL=1